MTMGESIATELGVSVSDVPNSFYGGFRLCGLRIRRRGEVREWGMSTNKDITWLACPRHMFDVLAALANGGAHT